MDIVALAYMQLEIEGLLNSKNETELMWDRAIKIRNFLTRQEGRQNRKK